MIGLAVVGVAAAAAGSCLARRASSAGASWLETASALWLLSELDAAAEAALSAEGDHQKGLIRREE